MYALLWFCCFCAHYFVYRASIGHVFTDANVFIKKNLNVIGKLDCSGRKCPAKGAFYDFDDDRMCSPVFGNTTVCAASVRVVTAPHFRALSPPRTNKLPHHLAYMPHCLVSQSWAATGPGAFSNPANWEAKKVPNANDVLVAQGNGKGDIQVSEKP